MEIKDGLLLKGITRKKQTRFNTILFGAFQTSDSNTSGQFIV